MSIFGYMRFAYLGRSDVKLARSADLDTRRQVLFDPVRLEDRFYLLEKISLPSLQWQTDKDFQFRIYTSGELPAPYRARLERAVASIPQVEIVYDDSDHITYAINPWIEQNPVCQTEKTIHFRLDDDDALSSDFISVLRKNMHALPHCGIITRPDGLFLISTDAGASLLAKFERYIAIGFAIVNDPGKAHNPYQLIHGAHYRRYPSLMIPGDFAYIHSAHLQSDTRDAQARKLQAAMAEHMVYYGTHLRRFRQAVTRQFAGRHPEHFISIMDNLPSTVKRAETARVTSG